MTTFRSIILLLVAALVAGVLGWDISNENDRQNCQLRTRNPLDGCESGRTVFVDAVGGGTRFKTVQSGKFTFWRMDFNSNTNERIAVASLPNNTGESRRQVYLEKGIVLIDVEIHLSS